MVDPVIDPDLSTLRDFVRQAANGPICHFGTHTGRSPQYSDAQVTRALAAAERAIAERERHDTPAWEANEKLNGTVEELCGKIERLRSRIGELEAEKAPKPDPARQVIPPGTKVIWKSQQCWVEGFEFTTNPLPCWTYTLRFRSSMSRFDLHFAMPRPDDIEEVDWDEPPT